jgi:hypothetical protein
MENENIIKNSKKYINTTYKCINPKKFSKKIENEKSLRYLLIIIIIFSLII